MSNRSRCAKDPGVACQRPGCGLPWREHSAPGRRGSRRTCPGFGPASAFRFEPFAERDRVRISNSFSVAEAELATELGRCVTRPGYDFSYLARSPAYVSLMRKFLAMSRAAERKRRALENAEASHAAE